MAEGGFTSGQGGVARVPGDQSNGTFPTGNGDKVPDTRDVDTSTYEGKPMGWFNHKTYAGGTPVGCHDGSVEGYASEARKMP